MEAGKADLLRSLAPLDEATLNRKPDAATWSLLQVVAHLTKSEAGTLRYVKKKTQDPRALPRAGVIASMRAWALVVGFYSPMKFKAPEGIADVPETSDLPTASLAWAEVREDWRTFVDGFPPELSDRMIFRHPFVGLLGPNETMFFMSEHLKNHARQAARIRKALGV